MLKPDISENGQSFSCLLHEPTKMHIMLQCSMCSAATVSPRQAITCCVIIGQLSAVTFGLH